jgi:hypothetical protein
LVWHGEKKINAQGTTTHAPITVKKKTLAELFCSTQETQAVNTEVRKEREYKSHHGSQREVRG